MFRFVSTGEPSCTTEVDFRVERSGDVVEVFYPPQGSAERKKLAEVTLRGTQ